MNIKVIQCVETGKYLSDYYEEYPFVGWWYYTDNLSKAMVFRNTFHIIDVMKMLHGSKYHHICVNKEYTNL